MKVKVKREQILEALKVPQNGADGAIVVLPDFLELEVEEDQNNIERLWNFSTSFKGNIGIRINQEFENLYRLIREMK